LEGGSFKKYFVRSVCVFENHCIVPLLISADAIFKNFWKIWTSLKVLSWCLDLGRLPIRAALSKRGAVNSRDFLLFL